MLPDVISAMTDKWILFSAFLLGCLGSVIYFYLLRVYGTFERFRTTLGKVTRMKIFVICLTGGLLSVLLELTIMGRFAPIHALILGACWTTFIYPVREIIQQKREHAEFVKESLIENKQVIRAIKIKDLMKRDINKISPDTLLTNFWSHLRDHPSHLIAVVHPKSPDMTIGIIGKRDIMDYLPEKHDLETTNAADVMNHKFVWAGQNETVDKVIFKMNRASTDRMIVLNTDSQKMKAVGWVTRRTLWHDINQELNPQSN